MFKRTLLAAALACAFPASALAVTDADLAAELVKMRAEFDQKLKDIQAAYEVRLKELETRQAQAAAAPNETQVSAAKANDFNPELSLVLAGSYAQREPGERHITGFLAGGHDHGGSRGFSLDHTELTLAANIDRPCAVTPTSFSPTAKRKLRKPGSRLWRWVMAWRFVAAVSCPASATPTSNIRTPGISPTTA